MINYGFIQDFRCFSNSYYSHLCSFFSIFISYSCSNLDDSINLVQDDLKSDGCEIDFLLSFNGISLFRFFSFFLISDNYRNYYRL